MIHLFLEQAKKRYLEVVLDAFECNRIIDSLSLLKADKLLKYEVSDLEEFKEKKDMILSNPYHLYIVRMTI